MRTIISDGTKDYHTSKVLVDPATMSLTENADGLPVIASIGGGGGTPALQIVTVAQGATLTAPQFVWPTLVIVTGSANSFVKLPAHAVGQGGWILYTGSGGVTQVQDNGGTAVPGLFVMLPNTWVTIFDDGTGYETMQPVDTPNVQEITGFKAFAGGGVFGGPLTFHTSTPTDTNYAMTVSDISVATNGLTAPRVITLPPSTTVPTVGAFQSSRVTVFDADGSVTGTNTVSVQPAGSDTINGSTSPIVVLSAAWDSADFNLAVVGKWQYKA